MRRHEAFVHVATSSLLVLSVIGCGQRAEPSKDAASSITGAPITPATAPPAQSTLQGSFDAISTTAMGITGDLTLTNTTLTFSRGLVYQTRAASDVEASQEYAKGAGSWADLLGVAPETRIEIRSVSAESVDAKAPNGGLCRPVQPTFIALASTAGMNNGPALEVAAFKSPMAPGPDADAADLCGTFNFAPH